MGSRRKEASAHCRTVCVCVRRVGDRGAPCLFQWLAPVTTHQQHTKPPEDVSVAHSLRRPHRSNSLPRTYCWLFHITGFSSILIFSSLCHCVLLSHTQTHIISTSLPRLLSIVILLYHCNIYSFSPPMCHNKVSWPLSKVLNEILGPPGWMLNVMCVCLRRESESKREWERATDGDACTYYTGRVWLCSLRERAVTQSNKARSVGLHRPLEIQREESLDITRKYTRSFYI